MQSCIQGQRAEKKEKRRGGKKAEMSWPNAEALFDTRRLTLRLSHFCNILFQPCVSLSCQRRHLIEWRAPLPRSFKPHSPAVRCFFGLIYTLTRHRYRSPLFQGAAPLTGCSTRWLTLWRGTCKEAWKGKLYLKWTCYIQSAHIVASPCNIA